MFPPAEHVKDIGGGGGGSGGHGWSYPGSDLKMWIVRRVPRLFLERGGAVPKWA